VTGPRHMIEDITNLKRSCREQLIDAINGLEVPFVVLDLKAGLDDNVMFLPYSNSGILVFTPHLPAATLAASDIVKANLFRKLRVIFAEGSAIYDDLKGIRSDFVNGLIDRVEDVYDGTVHNLDAFSSDLPHALGNHPVVKLVARGWISSWSTTSSTCSRVWRPLTRPPLSHASRISSRTLVPE